MKNASLPMNAEQDTAVRSSRDSSTAHIACMLCVPLSITPPSTNDVAMPSWFALRHTAVDSALSFFPNHVADSSGGVHWKKGCASPTSAVPTTSKL